MLRYYVAASALKFFSSTPATRAFYRDILGNRFGARRRARLGLDPSYVSQGRLLLELCKKHHAIADGMSILEVGTGWIHFYSLFLRLFYEIRITAVDAWDNRQFIPLQRSFADLGTKLVEFDLDPHELERATKVLPIIASASSFDDLYAKLGITYVIDPSLDSIADASQQLVCSFHVLEHIDEDIVERHVDNMGRVLRPGGFQVHQLGLDDHLAHYDRAVHNKNYLRYSERTWHLFFRNRVQYFSRIPRSRWLSMFERSGMRLLEDFSVTCDPATVRVHRDFVAMSVVDRACVIPTFVMVKNAAVARTV